MSKKLEVSSNNGFLVIEGEAILPLSGIQGITRIFDETGYEETEEPEDSEEIHGVCVQYHPSGHIIFTKSAEESIELINSIGRCLISS